jgi:hypothetical protein
MDFLLFPGTARKPSCLTFSIPENLDFEKISLDYLGFNKSLDDLG